jgi:hypothetical protein
MFTAATLQQSFGFYRRDAPDALPFDPTLIFFPVPGLHRRTLKATVSD